MTNGCDRKNKCQSRSEQRTKGKICISPHEQSQQTSDAWDSGLMNCERVTFLGYSGISLESTSCQRLYYHCSFSLMILYYLLFFFFYEGKDFVLSFCQKTTTIIRNKTTNNYEFRQRHIIKITRRSSSHVRCYTCHLRNHQINFYFFF